MSFFWYTNHPFELIQGKVNCSGGWGLPTQEKNVILLNSICDYFNLRLKKESIHEDDEIWKSNISRQTQILDYLKNKNIDELHKILRNLFASPLTHGTVQGDVMYNSLKSDQNYMKIQLYLTYDKLLSILEATNISKIFSPETYAYNASYDVNFSTPCEIHLEKIAKLYNFDISAPKYSGELFGLQTNYGLYGIHDFISMGIALTIADKFSKDIKICEIGGGAGHLAYYLTKLGFKNLTIVDLPPISVLQMYFLNSNIENNSIKFISPLDFNEKYDLVINSDSMPEMRIDSCIRYLDIIQKNAKHFLSFNQESGQFRVSDLCKMKRISRNMFWYRKGYVMEEYTNE